MRFLVTGAGGLLGRALVGAARERGHGAVGPSHEELDVTDAGAVEEVLARLEPDAVLHCAAWSDVDGAEEHPDTARAVNAGGTRHVARAASRVGALLLYPSSDYVFDGRARDPYLPGDEARPLNAYGRSKLAGEEAVRAEAGGGGWLIVRTSWLYGAGGGNFVDTVLERGRRGEALRVVDDQRGRPTWTGSLAPALVELVERHAVGSPPLRTLHLADRGTATWYGLARAALELAGVEAPVEAVSSEAWGAPALRPRNSVLEISSGEEALGRSMPPWSDSLARYLEERLEGRGEGGE